MMMMTTMTAAATKKIMKESKRVEEEDAGGGGRIVVVVVVFVIIIIVIVILKRRSWEEEEEENVEDTIYPFLSFSLSFFLYLFHSFFVFLFVSDDISVETVYCKMNVEQLVGQGLAGETEVLGGNLAQCHSVHHESHMTQHGIKPGPRVWEAGGYIKFKVMMLSEC
jgi:amino acid transporter